MKQVALIRQALSTYAPVVEPIDSTARKICDLIDRAFAIGAIDKDLLKCIALLNSINDKSFESLQTQVSRGLSDATVSSPYTSSQIRKLFQTVDSLSTLTKTTSTDTALTARDSKPSTHPHNHGPGFPCCEICYALRLTCRGHTKEWCIRPGGGMAGKTIEESRTARLAARGGAKGGKSKQGGGSSTIKNGIAVKGLDGQAYIVDVDNLQKIQLETTIKTAEFAGAITTNSTDFFEYGGFKGYRCYDPRTRKVYESYHVRFIERHDSPPPLTAATNGQRQAPAPTIVGPDMPDTIGPTSINDIYRTSSISPFTTDDDEESLPTPTPLPENIPHAPNDDNVAIEPRRSGRIRTPTAKASPDNPPITRTEQAVLDSRAAGDRLRASRTEAQNNRQGQVNINDNPIQHAQDAPAAGGDMPDHDAIPDLVNLASAESIEHLLAVAESFGDPHAIDLGDEPRTWGEAKASADAKQWEAGYKEELKSLKDMGVYKLVPRDQVPPGQKV